MSAWGKHVNLQVSAENKAAAALQKVFDTDDTEMDTDQT